MKSGSNIYRNSFFLYFCLFTFVFLLSASCSTANQSNQNTNIAEQPAFEVPTPQINLSKPLETSQNPDDVALAQKIDDLIEKSEFAGARWGVFAVSLKDGRVVVARDAQKLFTPASVQKILTSVVALDKFGADFHWKTAVFAQNRIEDGNLNGDLILYGEGAPDFNTESIENLVNQLQAKGLKRIKGNIVGDDSYFRGDLIGDGWMWNDLQWYYGAQASALSVNFNQVKITLQDGKPKVEPSTDLVQISGDVKPAEKGEPDAVGLKRDLAQNNVFVYGQGKNLDARVAVENPALWSAKIFRETLEKKGIKVEGEARSASWKTENKPNIENLTELAALESRTLGEIIRRMNKDSINLYAELILRTLGKKFGEEAPGENPRIKNVRGDDAAGVSVIKKWLVEKGVTFQETESIKDGSGLSRLNFVTPETIGRALIAASQIKNADAFRNSLPVAGTDGTLRGRLGGTRGRILGKTGSIMFVNSLAGYAQNERETFAFVILCNNETRKADSTILIDRIAASFID